MNKQQASKFKDYTNAYFNQKGPQDQSQRDELILNYTPLIKYIANRLASRLPPQVSVDDLISSGIIGLIDAIEKFDIEKKVQFKTYAEFRIKGAMLDELRSLDWVPRSIRRKNTELEQAYGVLEKKLGRPAKDEEIAQFLNISLDNFYKLLDETKSVTFLDIDILRQKCPDTSSSDFITDLFSSNTQDPFTALNLAELRDLVASAIDDLPEKERLTVSLYYFNELTMKEIGQVLGYTESRISQMHSKAMIRLRTRLKKALAS